MVLFPMLFEVRRIVCAVKIKQTLNNELKFHIVNIFTRMSGAMNRHCIPGLTMSGPDGELAGVSGNN